MPDSMDLKLLRTLQAEPALSVAELAEKIGLSHTPCWRRLKKLEADGLILERNVVLDADALGLHITVFCFIRLKQHDKSSMEAFENSARAHPNVLQCYTMSGEQDYMLRVVTKSIKTYENLMKNDLLNLPYVGQVNSSFAMSEIKNTTVLPI
ncbi:MAG: Lrp/AsnC family transcriptional regulator [Granulosicoccus sp.]